VGLPRESMISRAMISTIALILISSKCINHFHSLSKNQQVL
jgi:hypothetical protein